MLHIIGIIFFCILCVCIGAGIGGFYMGHKYCVELINTRNIANKHLQTVGLYDMWMSLPHDAIINYLNEKKMHNIVIYGFATLGQRLYYELKDSRVNIVGVIDRNPRIKIPDVNVSNTITQDKNVVVNAVIVTAIFSFDAIKKDLEENGYTNVISLYEILYDIKSSNGIQKNAGRRT